MNNNQLANDVYQTPSHQNDEGFDTKNVDEKFHAIEREAVLQAFNEITQDLEMSISGYESRVAEQVELAPAYPIATELLRIASEVRAYREQQQVALTESSRLKNRVGQAFMRLVTNGQVVESKPAVYKGIDQESHDGGKQFPKTHDVTGIKFFYLPEGGIDIWHYDQKSLDRTKNFTLSYKVFEHEIKKNATFYDERIADIINRSSIPSELEAYNLLVSAKKYYTAITEKPYIKSAAPRFRFGSKSDHDLAA